MAGEAHPIRIESDGTRYGTTVWVDDHPVRNAIALEFSLHVDHAFAEATLHLENVPVKFNGVGSVVEEPAQQEPKGVVRRG